MGMLDTGPTAGQLGYLKPCLCLCCTSPHIASPHDVDLPSKTTRRLRTGRIQDSLPWYVPRVQDTKPTWPADTSGRYGREAAGTDEWISAPSGASEERARKNISMIALLLLLQDGFHFHLFRRLFTLTATTTTITTTTSNGNLIPKITPNQPTKQKKKKTCQKKKKERDQRT
jgi:hypothetical protein